jgi:tetratricopeptide (TPR) repeat protein
MIELHRVAIAALFAIAATATSVAAQPADAGALEASGQRHYELAEYAAAIADFKEAFRITDQPELLFNIAQAYRLSGDCRQAVTFYKTFLRRVPDASNAEKVKGRIAEMETCAAKQPETPAQPETPTVAPTSPETTTSTSTRRRTWKTWAGIGALGAGALGAGAGAYLLARGSSKTDELRDLCATSCAGEEARGIEAAGNAANRNATIGFIAGGVLVAGGVALILIDRRSGEGPMVTPTKGGATASWTWSF